MGATRHTALLLMVTMFIGGCVTHRGSTLPALGNDFNERQRLLAPIDDWQLKGRIAVRTADDGFSASLLWRQDGREVDARLHGPLGVGAIHLDGNERKLRLERGNGEEEVLYRPEIELRRRYGWTVPVGSFRYWVLGIKDPRSDANLVLDGTGLLSSLEQGDWRVVYRDYQQVAEGRLPKRLVATSGDIKLTVSIKSWHIPYVE